MRHQPPTESAAEKLQASADALRLFMPFASEDARRQAAAAVAEAYGLKIPDRLNRRMGGRIPSVAAGCATARPAPTIS